MQSKAATVEQYLAELPPDRRAALSALRRVFLDNIGPDVEEGMHYGMIGYCIPHRVFPAGYHCDPKQPLPYAGMASQKNYMSMYLCGIYSAGDYARWFTTEWARTGKRLDMGKACIRFKSIDDVPLDLIAKAIKRMSAADYIRVYQAGREAQAASRPAAKPGSKASKKPAARKIAKKITKKSAKKTSAKKKAAKKPGAAKAGRK